MDEIISDLRAAIAASNNEQQQFAASVGVSDGTISRALSGVRPVDRKTAAILGYDRVRVVTYQYIKRQPAPEADAQRVNE